MIERKKVGKTSVDVEAKVIEEKINTGASAREIAKKAGTSERTASRIIKNNMAKIGEKSSAVAELLDRNNNLIAVADELIFSKIRNKEENIRVSELVAVRESAFKQNRLIEGESTENHNVIGDVLKDIQGLNNK